MSRLSSLLLLSLLVVLLSVAVAVPNVVFTLNSDHTATIRVNGATWLRTAATWFTANGKTYSSADKTLTLQSTDTTTGTDALGRYSGTVQLWQAADDASLLWMTIYRTYLNHTTSPAIVFDQVWVSGASGTSVGNSDAVLSSFPSFIPKGSATSLGALQWSDGFDTNKEFVWSGGNATSSVPLSRGGASGPLVLFDRRGMVAVTLSPFSNFMSASLAASKSGVAEFGVAGAMTSVPAGYALSTIAVFGDRGVTNNVLAWGDALLAQYGKHRMAAWEDFTTRYLGYATDNGAYYYYHTEDGKNYEQTLIDVYADALDKGIPYRHMLLDSWWYYKGELGGVKNWTARPDIFPSGLQALHANLTMPWVAHNRWWAPETDYAVQNGGQYDFVFANNFGLPTEQRFWDDLIRNSSVWGLRVYEQDWLFTVWDNHPAVRENITLGRNWLLQMGAGSRKAGINIQYCMPYPRHLLQSVEIPNVVQVRASTDNVPGNDDNWRVGESDLLAYALGVAPFKDTFWTASVQPGNPWNGTEPAPALQAAIATLSTGPVYPGDKVGYTNVQLLAMSHRSDGLLLKPDRPAFSLDSSYVERVWGASTGPDARQITHTFSAVNGQRWHVLLVAEEAHGYQLKLSEIGEMAPNQRFVTYSLHNSTWSLPQLNEWSSSSPLPLEPQTRSTRTFSTFWAAPVLSNGIAVLGDVSKWVPMSAQRIVAMTEWDSGVMIQLSGGANEAVSISYATYSQQQRKVRATGERGMFAGLARAAVGVAESLGDWELQQVDCVLSAAGSATVTIMTEGGRAQCTAI